MSTLLIKPYSVKVYCSTCLGLGNLNVRYAGGKTICQRGHMWEHQDGLLQASGESASIADINSAILQTHWEAQYYFR